jgi:hypothetical protein
VFELGADIRADRWVVPFDWEVDWVLTETMTPSTCEVDDGLDGSVVAHVAFGINSYRVPDCD